MRQRVRTASASPIRSPQPYMSQIVAAQSAGSPAVSASTWSSTGKMKSAARAMTGTGMSVQGDSASFLLRTVSLNTALMTRCAWLIRLADRPLRFIAATISLMSSRRMARIWRSPIAGYTCQRRTDR